MTNKHDNVGKCGHAKCAGGTGEHCYWVGKPMDIWRLMCPQCGDTHSTRRNSSDELQCDNCGFSETE